MGKVANGKTNVKRLAIAHLMRAVKCVYNGLPNQAVEHARTGYRYAVAWQAKMEKENAIASN